MKTLETEVPGEFRQARPFLVTAVAWLLIAAVAEAWAGRSVVILGWFFYLYALALVDLYALARLFQYGIGVMIQSIEKRPALIVRAFTWGAVKLACLGIFGLTLLHGDRIPVSALLMGLGTLVVVPLFGGLLWSRIELNQPDPDSTRGV